MSPPLVTVTLSACAIQFINPFDLRHSGLLLLLQLAFLIVRNVNLFTVNVFFIFGKFVIVGTVFVPTAFATDLNPILFYFF